jgi:multidrug efflux pump subunit AcrA (membrane-fusion protein)
MTPRLRKLIAPVLAAFASTAVAAACRRGDAAADGGAPPPAVVVHEVDGSLLSVDHPERFALVTASERDAAPTLSVTGVVSPDPSRAIPVVSLASGRVVDLRVRLGDHVEKGQLLLRVRSADVTLAFADYRKARADQLLARPTARSPGKTSKSRRMPLKRPTSTSPPPRIGWSCSASILRAPPRTSSTSSRPRRGSSRSRT